jgi:hypothetical protein
MSDDDGEGPVEPGWAAQRRVARRLVVWGLLRACALAAGLVALYFVVPLEWLARAPWGLTFTVALLVLAVVAALQVLAVVSSPNPGIRAIEGVAATTPLFLLLFASLYFVMARAEPGAFSQNALSRMDTLYFTVTVFATVGFGDIVATTTSTRVVVTLQMLLDLVVLGLGVRVFLGAVRLGRKHQGGEPRPGP